MKNLSRKNSILFLIFMAGFICGAGVFKFQIFPYSSVVTAGRYVKRIFVNNNYPRLSRHKIDSLRIKLEKDIIVTPRNLDSLRKQILLKVFGDTCIPSKVIDTIFQIKDADYDDIKNLKNIEQFELKMSNGIKSIGYVFHPQSSSGSAVIWHQGHGGDIILGKKNISQFVAQGYTVFSLCMPLKGKNTNTQIAIGGYGTLKSHYEFHEVFQYLDYPLSYFLLPVISIINSYYGNYKSFSMVGISGGGWTTTLAASVDPRIKNSFSVAGTLPIRVKLAYYPDLAFGDYEQSYWPLFGQIDYVNLYILASSFSERSHYQIYNLYDPCCFYGYASEVFDTWLDKRIQSQFHGNFDVFIDSSNFNHTVSKRTMSYILNRIKSN